MTQIGEGVAAAIIKFVKANYLFAGVKEVTFDSGIEIYEVDRNGVESLVPAANTPHWGTAHRPHPAVYVRQGGAGETNGLRVKVEWDQHGCNGAAQIVGESSDGRMRIEGNFNIGAAHGEAIVNCSFTRKPNVVANYRRGSRFKWTVTAGGRSATASGGSPLKLYFLDQAPRPFGWVYRRHYLTVIDWATDWAEGQSGSVNVFNALWSKFSDGTGAQIPHTTGFTYWKTGNPVQDLRSLVTPDGQARRRGMSCKAIAHMFMECLALHGMGCVEVVVDNPPGTMVFLVENWDVAVTPVNWPAHPTLYYCGSWIDIDPPPFNKSVSSSFNLTVDFRKQPGVPGQGQRKPPFGFQNHWIVQHGARLYDTSYGTDHPNNIDTYAGNSLAGWLVNVVADTYQTGMLRWVRTRNSEAWVAEEVAQRNLQRANGATN